MFLWIDQIIDFYQIVSFHLLCHLLNMDLCPLTTICFLRNDSSIVKTTQGKLNVITTNFWCHNSNLSLYFSYFVRKQHEFFLHLTLSIVTFFCGPLVVCQPTLYHLLLLYKLFMWNILNIKESFKPRFVFKCVFSSVKPIQYIIIF